MRLRYLYHVDPYTGKTAYLDSYEEKQSSILVLMVRTKFSVARPKSVVQLMKVLWLKILVLTIILF